METVFRVIIIYFFVMFGLRVLGKREFGEMEPFDLVVLLLIPELVAQALVREDFSLINGLVGVSTLLMLVFLTSLVSYRFPPIGRVIASTPTVLVKHGYLLTKQMNRERVGPEEILEAMHQVGLHRMEEVQWAILETDGRITIVPWQSTSLPNPGNAHTAGA